MAKKINRSDIVEDDIFGNLRRSAEETLSSLDKLNEELKETARIAQTEIKNAYTESAKGLKDFISASERATKAKINAEKVDQERLKTIKLIQDIQMKASREQERKTREAEKEAKAAERLRKAQEDLQNPYKQLVITTRNLKNESKELAAQMIALEGAGKKNTKQYRELAMQYKSVTAEAQKHDAQLKNIDSTVGDNFRNVGNYSGAIDKLKGTLAQFGVAVGAVQILKGAGETIMNFEQSMANLSSITGATGDDLKALEDAAIELGGKTTLSASQVAEGFKLIGSAKPELLQDKEALMEVTEAGIMLAEAAGITLPEAAAALTNTLNQFGVGAEEAGKFVDILASGSVYGAGDINFLNGAMEKAGTVANVAGLSFRETAAALEVIAKSGVPAEKAGTDFRNVLLKLQEEGIGFVDGQFNIREALDQTREMLASIEDPAERAEKASKLFGAQSVATAEFLMQNISLYDELNEKMDENGLAAQQQKTNTETLSGAIAILKSKWEEFILRMNQGGGIADKLKNIILLLANNLDKIFRVIGIVIKGFIAYKAIQIAIIARQKILNAQLLLNQKGFKGLIGSVGQAIKGMFSFSKGTGAASTSVKGFGTALKSIPFVAIIGAVLELASALWDVVTNADEAAEATARLEAMQKSREAEDEKAQANIEKNREGRMKRMQQQFDEIERKRREQVAKGQKTQKQADDEALQAKKDYLAALQTEIREEHKGVAKRYQDAKGLNDFMKSSAFGTGAEAAKFWGMNASKKQMEWLTNEGFTGLSDGMTRTNKIMSDTKKQTDEMNEELNEYKALLKDVNLEELESNAQHKKAGAQRMREIRTEFSNQIDLLEEINKLTREYVDLQKDLADVGREGALKEIDRQLKAEEEALKEASEMGNDLELTRYQELADEKLRISLEQIEEDRKASIKAINEKFDDTFDAQKKKLEDERDRLIENAKGNASKIKEIEANFEVEMEKLDQQRIVATRVKNKEIEIIEAKSSLQVAETRIKIEEDTQDKIDQIRIKAIEDRTNRELREEELRLLESGLKKEEIQKQLDLQEIALLEKQIAEKKALGLDTLDDEIKLAKLRRSVNEANAKDELALEKAKADERIAIAQALTDAMIELSNRRIAKIDEEIKAAEEQADHLRKLAENGNIEAKDSLAEQQKIIEEANARKEQEMKRQQQVQFAMTAYETYQRNASDESVENPLAKTITDLTLLNQFIRMFTPTFEKGTEDTGTHGRGIDGRGGFHAILHPNERVLTKRQNALVGDMTNEDLARIANEYNTGSLIRRGDGASQIDGGNWMNSAVLNRLESLEKTIQHKPETNIEFGEIIGGAMQIIKTQKKGSTTVYNRYKVK